jgi:hypothetical protein
MSGEEDEACHAAALRSLWDNHPNELMEAAQRLHTLGEAEYELWLEQHGVIPPSACVEHERETEVLIRGLSALVRYLNTCSVQELQPDWCHMVLAGAILITREDLGSHSDSPGIVRLPWTVPWNGEPGSLRHVNLGRYPVWTFRLGDDRDALWAKTKPAMVLAGLQGLGGDGRGAGGLRSKATVRSTDERQSGACIDEPRPAIEPLVESSPASTFLGSTTNIRSEDIWLPIRTVTDLEGVTADTLRNYRHKGTKIPGGRSGIDLKGREWRKSGPNAQSEYLRSSLISSRKNRH